MKSPCRRVLIPLQSFLYECPRAIVANDHKLSSLKQPTLFSHSSGGQRSYMEVWTGPPSLRRL